MRANNTMSLKNLVQTVRNAITASENPVLRNKLESSFWVWLKNQDQIAQSLLKCVLINIDCQFVSLLQYNRFDLLRFSLKNTTQMQLPTKVIVLRNAIPANRNLDKRKCFGPFFFVTHAYFGISCLR